MSNRTDSSSATAGSTVAMTGSGGFLGWHTRAALLETGTRTDPVRVGQSFSLEEAVRKINGTSRLIHIAGVNRARDEEVLGGNVMFAEQMAESLRHADVPPPVVVYANSIQEGNGSPYGEGKARAAEVLARAAQAVGSRFVDVKLPNLFGEHGRPYYNAVTATFCNLLSQGEHPAIDQDKELTLLHAQDAADLLTGARPLAQQTSVERHETVSGLLNRLTALATVYGRGEIPDVATDFSRDLFNTYRSYTVGVDAPIRLTRHSDARGSFFEIIRSHGGSGQSSFSTTASGIARGDHYHRRKVERFTVLSGKARISIRRLFTGELLEFEVEGEAPVAIDMPTMWAHKITNIGSGELFTSFWTNDLFNPDAPDTISEAV